MPLSYSSVSGGSSSSTVTSNDFIINTGTSGYTTSSLSRDFPSGTYVITSALSDTSYDIYLVTSSGTLAGSVNSTTAQTTVTASAAFNKVLIYGTQNNDTYTFTYKYVFAPSTDDTSTTIVGPRITSISPSSLPNNNDTTTITGKNFATNVAVTFTGSNNVVVSAKSVVRNSSTSLTVTRPDNLSTAYSPYTITVSNPGIASPTATGGHILTNASTVGSVPIWTTSAGELPTLIVNSSAYSQTIVGTDPDTGGSVTYSIASGSLPSGLTLNSSTGVISGTTTATYGIYNFTARVTDAGGNYVDRAFSLQNYPASDSDNFNRSAGSLGSTSNKAQVWITDSGSWYTNGSAAQSDTAASSYPLAHIVAPNTNKTTSVSSQPGTGVAFWVQDANNWWGTVPYYASSTTTNYTTTCGTRTLGTSANCGLGNGNFNQCYRYCCNGTSFVYYSYAGENCENYGTVCNTRGGLCDYGFNGYNGAWGYVNVTNSTTNTNYDTYLKTIRNSSGSITDYDVYLANTNTSGYANATSIAVSTSTGSVTISGTYSRSLSPGAPSTNARGFGILKAPGGSQQGSTVDDFSLS